MRDFGVEVWWSRKFLDLVSVGGVLRLTNSPVKEV